MEMTQTLPRPSFGEAVKTCFKKYASFGGRARRAEFWWFALLCWIPNVCASALVAWKMSVRTEIESQLTGALSDSAAMDALMAKAESCDTIFYLGIAVIGIVMLALLLPSLAVAVRRLHDTGRSGWLLLLGIIPIVNFVGAIVLFVFFLQDSKPAPNKFGLSPKYIVPQPSVQQ